jgi:hypothetical protein
MATIRMPEHQPHQHGDTGEDYNIGTLVTVAVIGLIALVWSVIWLKAVYVRADRYEWERKVVPAHFSEREAWSQEQEQRLTVPDWTDPAHNRISRPILDVQGDVLLQLLTAQQGGSHAGAVMTSPATDTAQATAEVHDHPAQAVSQNAAAHTNSPAEEEGES